MNNFELANNTEIEDRWQKEKLLWEKKVKDEIWPVYSLGAQIVKEKYNHLFEVFYNENSSADSIKVAADELYSAAKEALEKFDGLSNAIIGETKERLAINLAIDMVNHRARKFFSASIAIAAGLRETQIGLKADNYHLPLLDELNLVEETYFYSVLEAGNPREVDLKLYLDSFKYDNEYNNGNGLTVETAGDTPDKQVILGHQILLDEAIKEFINNAREAMHDKGKIVIGAYEEGKNICFFVQDNGPGIAQERQDEIWLAKNSSKEHGTGMGLHYLRMVIEDLMRGSVTVESEIGKGAKFVVTIPEIVE